MPFPIFYRGQILFRNGTFALDINCCCETEYCIEGGPYCGCIMPGAPPEPYLGSLAGIECPRRFSDNLECDMGYYGRGSNGAGVAIENLQCRFFEPSNPFIEEFEQVGESYRCGNCDVWFAIDGILKPGYPGQPTEYVHVQVGFETPDPLGQYADEECVWVLYFSRAGTDCLGTRFEVAPSSCSGTVSGTLYADTPWPQTWSFNVVGGRPA